ncbi:MAG: hypothetical protein ACMG6E_10850 [Candidatus Roizmanbacteria bacterium]
MNSFNASRIGSHSLRPASDPSIKLTGIHNTIDFKVKDKTYGFMIENMNSISDIKCMLRE